MGTFKWIAGLIGWASGGPIGALIGFLFGSMVDSGIDSIKMLTGGSGTGDDATWGHPSGSAGPSGRTGGYTAAEQRNSFMVSLLVLSSAVIRADGRFLQAELDYVRAFLRTNFGEQSVDEGMRILNDLNSKDINVYSVGTQIAGNMNYSQRLQLFHYLADLANSDGSVCAQEKDVLQAIGAAISLNSSDIESILAMFSKSRESAYTILEITPSATDDEVKKAYRRLAMKYHPDKVAQLGPEVQKAAEAKFQKIQQAYDRIKKERGIV